MKNQIKIHDIVEWKQYNGDLRVISINVKKDKIEVQLIGYDGTLVLDSSVLTIKKSVPITKYNYVSPNDHKAKILTSSEVELDIADELIDLYDRGYIMKELQVVLDKLNALPKIENGCLKMINELSLGIYASKDMDEQILTLI